MRQSLSRKAELRAREAVPRLKAVKGLRVGGRCREEEELWSFSERSSGGGSSSDLWVPRVSGMASVTGMAMAWRQTPRVKGSQGFLAIRKAAKGGPIRKQR